MYHRIKPITTASVPLAFYPILATIPEIIEYWWEQEVETAQIGQGF